MAIRETFSTNFAFHSFNYYI